ncbi:MAG: L,D-transpeptidase family protein [Pseudomonadota bacterium]
MKNRLGSLVLISAVLSAGAGMAAENSVQSNEIAKQSQPLHVIVSISDQSLKVYQGTNMIAQSNVSTGKSGNDTPTGVFSILEKKKFHRSNIYSNAPMPFMQRLTWSGIALHASNSVPAYPASHGCVRLPNSFAPELYKLTKRGAHVVINSSETAPVPVSHPTLFQPVKPRDATKVAFAGPTSTLLRGTNAMTTAKAETDGNGSPIKASEPKKYSEKPLRILITRRTENELMADVQRLLNELGYKAGDVDGYFGPTTAGAIKRFQKIVGLKETGTVSKKLISELYRVTAGTAAPTGHIYVRQGFKPLFDAPMIIRKPEERLGAALYTVAGLDAKTGVASWLKVALKDQPKLSKKDKKSKKAETSSFLVMKQEKPVANVLDRLNVPADIRKKISERLTHGSSLAISDHGLGPETGKGTDFVVLTRG